MIAAGIFAFVLGVVSTLFAVWAAPFLRPEEPFTVEPFDVRFAIVTLTDPDRPTPWRLTYDHGKRAIVNWPSELPDEMRSEVEASIAARWPYPDEVLR